MEIRCRCTGCSAKFKVDAKYAGKKARCPKCQAVVEVPLAGEESTVTASVSSSASASQIAASKSSTSKPVATRPGTTTVAIPVVRQVPAAPMPQPLLPPEPEPEPVAPTISEFPSFTTKPAPAGGASPASSSSQPRGRKKSSPLLLILGGGALVVVAGLAAVGVFLATSGGDKSGKGGKPAVASSANKATLVLDWPQAQRSGGAVKIDGKPYKIPAAAAIKFTLSPGEHQVVALRRGYEPFDTTFNVVKGQETTIAPIWKESTPSLVTRPDDPFPIPTISVAGFEGWPQDFERAKHAAAAAKKDLLIVFGCSDNDEATQQLASSLGQAGVQQSHVCVVLDFPDTTRGMDVVADQGQSRFVAEQFGVQSLPTLALADEEGRAYFLKRDWSDGFESMPSKIVEWSKLKAERDTLLAAAGQGSEQEKLAAAAKAARWLQDKDVWFSHGPEIKNWLADAQKIDSDNHSGLLEVFFELQWLLDVSDIRSDDAARVDQVISQLDPWVARKFQDPDRGAKLHMMAAYVLAQLERLDEAAIQVDYADKYKPKDAKLASGLETIKRELALSKLLGTGTGFLISSAGYVLTNHHVIEGDGQIEVRLYDQTETLAAKIVKSDAQRDIALLKITLPEGGNYKPLPVAIRQLKLSEDVIAYGHPLGDRLGGGVKSNNGHINGVPDPNNGNMLLLDMKINRGNSGGPLCDNRANVVGMVTAKYKGGAMDDSIGLAIPAADLIKFLDEHLPPDTSLAKPPAAGEKMDWPEVGDRVQPGVVMVLNKKK